MNHASQRIDTHTVQTVHGRQEADVYVCRLCTVMRLRAYIFPDGYIEEAGGMWMYFDFHFFNPISLTPFTSIIIYSQDLPINSQVHGFVSSLSQYRNLPQITFDNSTTQVTSSAQIDRKSVV